MIRTVVFTALLLATIAARSADLPREFTATSEIIKEAPAYLTQVVVPESTCAAVNPEGTLLVVGRKSGEDNHLAVFRLDAEGRPTGEPTWIALPKPEVMEKHVTYPLGLLFHPRLPLLYVWQDVTVFAPSKTPPKPGQVPDLTAFAEFDHLLTFSYKDGELELVQTGASGVGFHCGLNAGTIGLDYGEKNLFVPNAQGETYDEAGIGFYALDDEGIPGDAPETGGTPGAKSKKKPDMTTNISKIRNKKAIRVVALPKQQRTNHYFPSGAGWFAGSEAMLMGGYSGCMMADFNNGSLRQTWFGLPDRVGPCTLVGHPTLPAVYLCLQENLQLAAIAHANGYLTLLPQLATVPGAHFVGIPVVLTGQSRLAVGDTKSLHLFGLQADGKFDGTDQLLKLPCVSVKGLAYSEKLNRLFVAVDKAE